MQKNQNLTWNYTEIEKGKFLFDLRVDENFRGIVYRVSALLFANGFSIEKVNVDHKEKDWDFLFLGKYLGPESDLSKKFQDIEKDLRDLIFEKISVTTYLIKKGKSVSANEKKENSTQIKINNSKDHFTILEIATKDKPGILFQISQVLYLACVEIIYLSANTIGQDVKDEFHITLENKEKLDEALCTRIQKNLLNIL